MKVLQINAVYRNFSTGRSAMELNNAFRQMGREAAIAFSVGTIDEPEREYLIGNKCGQIMHALLSRLTGLQGYFSTFATKNLLQYMNQYKPDIVVLRNLHANYIHLPRLLEYLAKNDIPTIAVLHDCWFYTGKCCHYTTIGCYRWQEKCGKCPVKRKYNVSWFFDRTEKMLADKEKGFTAIPRLGVVAVSDWMLREARATPVFSKAVTITRIRNWIDTELFAPGDGTELRKKLGLQDKNVILCVASGWDENKGLSTVIAIAERLQKNEQLVIIGNLPRNRKIPDGIVHIPVIYSSVELAEYYQMADVFLQPSLEETFGKVAAEALCCGTPVVCFNSTANPELIGDNCGSVVPVGDLDAMLREIRMVLTRGKAYYSPYCRAFAQKNFDVKKIVPKYLALFEQMQNKSEPGREEETAK